MKSSAVEIGAISEQAQTFRGSRATEKLLAMLQSMSQRWPDTKVFRTSEGFGVLLEDSIYLAIHYSGPLTDEDMRDWLALFATWLVADGASLRGTRTNRVGR